MTTHGVPFPAALPASTPSHLLPHPPPLTFRAGLSVTARRYASMPSLMSPWLVLHRPYTFQICKHCTATKGPGKGEA